MTRIRVLVVDDHRIFAEALATALAAEPDVDVGAAGTVAAAERALERAAAEGRSFDVILVDADLGSGGPAAGPARRPRPAGADLDPGPPGPGARRAPMTLPGQRRPGTAPSVNGNPGQAARLPAQRSVGDHRQPPTAGFGFPPAPVAGGFPSGAAAVGSVGPGNGLASQSASGQHGSGSPALARVAGQVGGTDGITLIARARRAHPGLRAIVLATADDPRRVVRALHAGAGGWVAKESSLGRLMAVVRGVLRDETHIPPALLTAVLRELTAARRDRTESERLVESLTPREKQVLRCMVAGLGRQAVAERLYLSPHTVRTHMQNVLGKLGVHSTLAAVAVARRAGVGPAETGPAPLVSAPATPTPG